MDKITMTGITRFSFVEKEHTVTLYYESFVQAAAQPTR